jgi:hypothetical protein
MNPKVSPPKIDARKANDLLRQLRGMAPHYTKEWPAIDDDDPGVALLKIFSFIAEGVINRFNRAPERNFLAFLDMLGIRLLPATPARAPVRFLVAKGTEDSFLVPKRTQVSAAASETRPVELPFETIESLQVIPATLSALLAVDPENDHIYKSPPGFLELEVAATELPALKVTAFSAAKSKFLQLDPPDQVKEGDFLRIEQELKQESSKRDCIPIVNQDESRAIDHLVVSAVKGSIVTVRDPLPQDYAEGTQVQKVTRFELFEGKNWQEHILYLAHAEYLAIKSEAQITLLVEHAAGVSSNLEAFNVVWEFFGVIETDKEKEEGWHEFQVDLDGTQGFSRNGQVVLIKPAGEIKEKEINGSKSRWIRARLDEPLPATPPRPLPKIESITFTVSSGGKDLAADQAFNNDTPLTTNLPFFPFGTEPRIFDRFSIASEEAFSKPGAEVTLDFTLDATDLLAAPAAIINNNKARVFAHAAAGRLVEFQVDPLTYGAPIKKHGTPPDTRITAGSIPAVVTDTFKVRIGIFVKANDGKIYLRFVLGNVEAGWQWVNFQAPAGELQFNPSAVLINNFWQVFVVANNQLFSKTIDPIFPNIVPSTWTPHPGVPQIDSTPFAVDLGNRAAVFVTDVDGRTWKFDTVWTDLTPTISGQPNPVFVAAKNARPYVVPDPTKTQFRIFLRSKSNQLVAIDTVAGNTKSFDPIPDTLVDSNPFLSEKPSENRVYVRAADNRLWSIEDSTLGAWTPHLSPSDFSLASDPFAIVHQSGQGDFVSVFSTSDKNSLLEFRVRGDDVNSGTFQAGPLDIIVLEHNLPSGGNHYIHITDGPGKNSDADAVRKLDLGLTRGTFAVLEDPLDESPDTDTTYDLLREESSGQVQSAGPTTLKLAAGEGANVQDGDYVFVLDQLRQIPNAPVGSDIVTVDNAWTTQPSAADTYFLLRLVPSTENSKAGARSIRRAVLDTSASNDDDEYTDLFLEITAGPGQNPAGRRIADYFGSTRNVVLAQDFSTPPDNTSDYRITLSSLSQGWFAYQDPDQTELRPELSWEYWNGRGWVALAVKDETKKFLIKGTVTFTLPEDIEKTEVAGQENYWIRARIVGGDYGRELFSVDPATNKIKVEKDPIRPPLVKKLGISYAVTQMKPPQLCLIFNNLNYLDQTAANVTPDKHFSPYIPLSDTGKAVYFGFDRAFDGGPIRTYFAARELEVDERNKPKLTWEFAFNNDWSLMLAEDDTDAFTKPEFVSLLLREGFQNRQQFGQALFWLRATLAAGSWTKSPLFEGVFINTVEALQARTILEEIVGSSTGIKNQLFRLQQLPVIEDEEIRVREILTDDEREQLIAELGEEAVLALKDQQDRILETWIRWTEVQEFFDSEPGSRHYRLDRATGELEFGDGVRGRIPAIGGDNIKAFSYQAGGGAGGNVKPGEITSAVTAVAGVDSVINPVSGGGGSEAATNDDMLVIGPEQISNRGRAVTPDDFEQLAREASREVRKALCLPNRNAAGRPESGWTSVYIVPDSRAAEPMPSLELRRAVQRFLAQRADVTLVDQEHIFVGPPQYVPVSVDVTVFARSLDVVASAEQSVRRQLDQFLHPLTGGPAGEGWDFGRDLAASDLYSLLEDIGEVDHVGPLRLLFGDKESEERVEVGANALVASGTHKITMSVGAGE